MTLKDIANIRLHSQQIEGTTFKSPKELLGWMGAMQAQDYQMAKWAVGSRVPNSTDKEIETALDKGQLIRTHLLRPTWHLVSADDVYWMLELTAPHIKPVMKTNNRLLELDEQIFAKCNKIIEKALRDGNHLTRDELMAILRKTDIATHSNRPIHIMFYAELEGIVCNGVKRGNQQTYSLLAERVPKVKTLPREEALAKLAKQYFSSHGPATVEDFKWWSGLPAKDARNALETVKPNFNSETVGEATYWFNKTFSVKESIRPSVYLLPAFDEFLISYKNRTALFPKEINKKTFTSNGIFRPIVVVNGQITGIWKRTIKKDKVLIETELFHPHNKTVKKLIEKAAGKYGDFLGKEVEVRHIDSKE